MPRALLGAQQEIYYFAGIIGVAIGHRRHRLACERLARDRRASRKPAPAVADAAARRPAQARRRQRRGRRARARPAVRQRYRRPEEPEEEHNWLERAARHGNVQAQYELGIALRDGRGTVQDYEEARKWLQRAAEGGNGQGAVRARAHVPDRDRASRSTTSRRMSGSMSPRPRECPGAASARDAVLSRLSPAELLEAQAEARRMSEIYIPKAVRPNTWRSAEPAEG